MQDERLTSETRAADPCDKKTCAYYDQWRFYQSGKVRQVIVGNRSYKAGEMHVIWCMTCKHFKPIDQYRVSPDEAARLEEEKRVKPTGKKKDHED